MDKNWASDHASASESDRARVSGRDCKESEWECITGASRSQPSPHSLVVLLCTPHRDRG